MTLTLNVSGGAAAAMAICAGSSKAFSPLEDPNSAGVCFCRRPIFSVKRRRGSAIFL